MKQETLNYFNDLNYTITTQSDEVYELNQNRTGLTVELNFSVLNQGKLPELQVQNTDKKLFFLALGDVEQIGIDNLEPFFLNLDEHCSLVVLEEEFFEQSMKEIWMFLAKDPRERDAFKESKYYKG
ncbi:hypothetical protein ACOMICROBIO_FLGHMIGD_03292 [Vibrio sp. B1FLJ16]|uniref:hypothetical protein n=1 Tax=Vibrio sp. B1FLJ16 TaxID=2751178 RepID=UPI0015F67DBA|nr:hypothetical protein [Vibrio sp. B1FLJ16]CAD7824242.1 hypothetical protein ACOMICROBIO_FLGHMIGD_03292 [Vibrio sp. B1FLJ16]CAE6954004.1 hypothetical protein ACOMICROBIO_FLGHMIGD_03292 [Vibrio sp. B1FLJ16]